EVLGDDRRRAAYDASLMHDPVAAPPHHYHASPRTVAIALGVIALLSAAIVMLMRPHSSASALRDQVASQANVSVARLQPSDTGLTPQEVKALGTVAVRNGAAIEIDRAIAPAEEGAAVFDSQGKLAGIATSAGSTADGRGVVLPAAWITAARARPAPPR